MHGLHFMANLCPCRAGAWVPACLLMTLPRGRSRHGAAVPRYIDGPQAAR